MAHNEALFREVNETIAVAHPGFTSDTRYICECSDANCFETTPVPREEYRRVRSHPTWFIVIPGHECPQVEAVVERHPSYLVVEKPARLLDDP
jgi:hypothetical protein